MTHHLDTIARETGISLSSVSSTAKLLAEGGTVPFISRYRKEQTGSLDEVQITTIRDRMLQLAELDSRRGLGGGLDERVVVDGEIITSCGAGTALDFALALITYLAGEHAAERVAEEVMA